jgi:hypothetical protein
VAFRSYRIDGELRTIVCIAHRTSTVVRRNYA